MGSCTLCSQRVRSELLLWSCELFLHFLNHLSLTLCCYQAWICVMPLPPRETGQVCPVNFTVSCLFLLEHSSLLELWISKKMPQPPTQHIRTFRIGGRSLPPDSRSTTGPQDLSSSWRCIKPIEVSIHKSWTARRNVRANALRQCLMV